MKRIYPLAGLSSFILLITWNIWVLCIYLSFLLRDQKKRNQRKVTGCVSGVAKNTSHLNFGGDTTRYAQTVSPLLEILAPFLTPDTMPEVADTLTRIVWFNSANECIYNSVKTIRSSAQPTGLCFDVQCACAHWALRFMSPQAQHHHTNCAKPPADEGVRVPEMIRNFGAVAMSPLFIFLHTKKYAYLCNLQHLATLRFSDYQ